MKQISKLLILFNIFICFFIASNAQQNKNTGSNKTLKFVSFPDFFNFDIPKPWPGYDTAVNYFLDRICDEKPNFVMVDGDLVNGHWWDSPKCVEHMGAIYYSACTI
jgi:hypothetical protein